jgi:hypothetical protein
MIMVPIRISPRAIVGRFIASRKRVTVKAVAELAKMLGVDTKTARAIMERKKVVVDDKESCRAGRPRFSVKDAD